MFAKRLSFIGFALGLVGVASILLAQSANPDGRKFALLVGVKTYLKSELRPLKYTENDVNALAEVLQGAGYRRVLLMTQANGAANARLLPTADNIGGELSGILADCKANDSLVVSFSGHGVQFKGEAEHYFCPADARLSDRKSLIALTEVYAALRNCKAQSKLLLVDACRNDPQSDLSKDTAGEKLESVTRPQRVTPPGGVAALFSCTEGQKSYESDDLKHGIFFHTLLQGLKGKAANNKGEVDVLALAQWAQDEVPIVAKEQIDRDTKQLPEFKSELKGRMVLLGGELPPLREPERLRPNLGAAQVQQIQKAWAQYLGKKVEEEIDLGGGVSMSVVLVPPGMFRMGSSAAEVKEAMRQFDLKEDYIKDELPSHDVEMTKPFLMGKYEVTKRQFGRFVTDNGYKTEAETEGGYGYNAAEDKFEGRRKLIYNWRNTGFTQTDDHPVVNISWNDADKFVSWLGGKSKRRCGLPSEAQWEYACRACTTTLFTSGDDAETLAQVGNVSDGTANKNGYRFTAPVGHFRPNALGLQDMHGNVWEWCQDWYDEKLYANSSLRDPINEHIAFVRVQRGGSWLNNPRYCRAAYRGKGSLGDWSSAVPGFRVVVPVPSKTP